MQRGNNRSAVFFTEADYAQYLEWLKDAAAKYGCPTHDYVLMTNRVNRLLSSVAGVSIAKPLRTPARRDVRHITCAYHLTGTLSEGRYLSTVIENERYGFSRYRYVELHQVRAGMVESPGNYRRCSSHQSNALGGSNPLLTHISYTSLEEACRRTAGSPLGIVQGTYHPETLPAIRETTNKGWALARVRFK